MTRVGIVGAGITGLALAHQLSERGVDAETFEAAPEPGGVIRSTTRDDVVLEHGPQRLRCTDEVAALVDEFGLRDDLITAAPGLPLYVYADGGLRRVPKTLREFVTTDLLSWRGKLRVLAEPLTDPIDPDESVASAFERKFGREVAERVVDPLVGGIYASDTHRLRAGRAVEPLRRLEAREGSLLLPALKRLWGSGDTPPPATFREGLQALPIAIADRYADRVHLGDTVASIESTGDGYLVVSASGDTGVDHVVVTAAAPDAAPLLEDLAPEAAEAVAGLTYNPLAIVHLRSDVRRRGFGYQIRAGEGFRTLGVTWNAGLFDRDGVYTCFLGGMRDPGILDEPDAELGRVARDEFRAVMDAPAEVLNVTRYRDALPAYDESWNALDGLEVPDGVWLPANYAGRLGIPSRIRAAERVAATIDT